MKEQLGFMVWSALDVAAQKMHGCGKLGFSFSDVQEIPL